METTTAPTVSLADQLTEAKREFALRQRVYPRWIAEETLPEHVARQRLAAQAAIVATLEGLVSHQATGQGELFS